MQAIIVQVLQLIAKGVDKAVPLQGGRTILVAVLTIIGNVAMYLTGKSDPTEVANNLLLSFGLIYAALHKPKPTE